MQMSSLWSSDNPERLLKLASDIEAHDGWRGFLSKQEHKLFQAAVKQGGNIWNQFINGHALCQVAQYQLAPSIITGPTLAKRDPSIGGNLNGNRPSHLKSEVIVDEETRGRGETPSSSVSRTGSTAPVERKEQLTSINLDPMTTAFRVRYMLYEKSLPVLFPEPELGMVLDIDPAIFEDDDDEPEQNESQKNETRNIDDDNYDDDDENDEEKQQTEPTEQDPVTEVEEGTDASIANNEHPVIRVTIHDQEDEREEENLSKAKDVVINNYNKMYHIFEYDRENALRQRHLDESDRQVDSDILDENATPDMAANGKPKSASASFGAANLSLKHLLATIEAKRDALSMTDFELKNLISDVRKNRSKWASEDKIGQEELYEAAEKVVLELRGYTEHSTAFLNKVNKRDAPNYFNVVKHPMDLSTVMKKLKSFQYKSKKEFVADLMLIWRNCLTYNTDPKHFLRIHAIAMQKRTLTLIPLIPDITVRDRSEVEAEEAKAAQEEAEDEEDGQAKMSGMGVGKGSKHASKGKKRKLGEAEEEDSAMTEANDSANVTASDGTVTALSNPSVAAVVAAGGTPRGASPAPGTPRSATPGLEFDGDSPLLQTEDGNSDNEQQASSENGIDFETAVWQEVFTKRRAEYCCKRGDLFRNNNLQMDAEATIRKSMAMGRFYDITSHIFEHQDESGRLKRERFFQSRGLLEALDSEKQQFILEYEVGSGIPADPIMAYDAAAIGEGGELSGFTRKGGSGYHSDMARLTEVAASDYVLHGGLAGDYHKNLANIQDIRRICSKIALVRQVQHQQYMHNPSAYHPEKIQDLDLDVESRLPDRDQYDGPASLQALKRSVAKVAMHSGFEVTEIMAVETLSEIACDYISNLGKILMLAFESPEYSSISAEDKVVMALQDQGIESLASLDVYVRDDIQRHSAKLADLQRKLTSFLADLLRPGIQELSDNQFGDGSDQFLNGDFSQQIGDDFFGFKELGLDKELGILGASVPFHLLQSRLSANVGSQLSETQNKEFTEQVPEYPAVNRAHVKKQLGLLQHFLLARIDTAATATQVPKPDGDDEMETVLLENDRLPPKQRNTRPKLPPTGKTPGIKKKYVAKCFFMPTTEATWEAKKGNGNSLFGFDENNPNFLENHESSLDGNFQGNGDKSVDSLF